MGNVFYNAMQEAISDIGDYCALDNNQKSAAKEAYRVYYKQTKDNPKALDVHAETFVFIGGNIAGSKSLDDIISDLNLTENEKKELEKDIKRVGKIIPDVIKMIED